jgi:hypothetical protein
VIDVEMPDAGTYAGLARRWFDAGFTVLAPGQRASLETGPKLPPEAIRRPMQCGPPGATWGFVSVSRDFPTGRIVSGLPTFKRKASHRVWTARSWKWFLEQLADPPDDATLGTAHLEDVGPWKLGSSPGYPEEPRIRMTVWKDKWAPDWLRLAFAAPESDLSDPGCQAAWLAFIRETAENLNPAFGIIDYEYDYLYGEAAAEHLIRDGYLRHERVPRSRQQLRGYDWLTICPQELADRLGGTDALRATSAFHEVSQLSGGGVWLRATADYRDFDNAALYCVFRALAAVLPAGMPLRIPGREDYYRIVYQDAASIMFGE